MPNSRSNADFPEHVDENRRIWTPRPAVKWENMPDVPPIQVVRMRKVAAAGRW